MAHDWIVIGGGLTGVALGYELAQQGASVLLLEQFPTPQNATRLSYGGLAYWSGTTDLTRQLCTEAQERYPTLSAELGVDIQFRELDLLLTIPPEADLEPIATAYAQFATTIQRLTPTEATAIEPLLNREAIGAALLVRHGHVSPQQLVAGYSHAFQRSGGVVQIEKVTGLQREGDRVTGVITTTTTYPGANVVVCAGGLSRALLAAFGLAVPIYFTHTEVLITAPVEVRLQAIVMAAEIQRFSLEAAATTAEVSEKWDQPGLELVPPILDVGAIQFLDGSLRFGQPSRILTDPHAHVDPSASEAAIRAGIGQILPTLRAIPASWHSCLVAFSGDRLPLIGALPALTGLHLFSGFSNPFVLVPPLAQRFAKHVTGSPDPILAPLSPDRFVRCIPVLQPPDPPSP